MEKESYLPTKVFYTLCTYYTFLQYFFGFLRYFHCSPYSEAPKSKQFGFQTENNGSVVKPWGFRTRSEIQMILYLKHSRLVECSKSEQKSSDFGQKITFKNRTRKILAFVVSRNPNVPILDITVPLCSKRLKFKLVWISDI